MTVQMNRDDGLGSRCDRVLELRGVEIVRAGVDVHEHRRRPGVRDPRTVAMNVLAAVITSSPGPMPEARMMSSSAESPESVPTA